MSCTVPQLPQNAGASSNKYSEVVLSGGRNPFAMGILPNDMNGRILSPHTRQSTMWFSRGWLSSLMDCPYARIQELFINGRYGGPELACRSWAIVSPIPLRKSPVNVNP
jgi:hypothetical protein